MQKIRPCLWFDDQAEDAANFYVSVFGGDSAVVLFGTNQPRPVTAVR
ncbi:VOC family protein [Streptomyces sp. NBC_00887]|nr:VOC family protein [Streptomyces sp. NBC_00887]